ncbi:MAG TPA: hypothetical protein VGF24_01610 [Vicinamibacterales bacterium]
MSTILDRAAVLAIGILIGISIRGGEIDRAAISIYVVAGALIVVARLAVVRHREKKEAQREPDPAGRSRGQRIE